MREIGRASQTAGGIGRWRRPLAIVLASTTLGSLLALASAAPAHAAPSAAKTGRIAYLVEGDTSTELWIADKDGGNRHKLLDAVSGNAQPQWHPAGGELAYTSAERDAPTDALVDLTAIRVVDADTGQWTAVTSDPEKQTREDPCTFPSSPPGCTETVTSYTWDSDRLVDWSPDGTGMLARRQHHVAFSDGADDDFYWWRITGAGGVLTDAGRKQSFPGTDDWTNGEACSDAAISSSLPEVGGNIFFLDDVVTDRFAYGAGPECTPGGDPGGTFVDGSPMHVTFPVPDPDGNGGAVSTIAPDGRFTVYGPDGFWETTAAGSPTTPLSVTRTTPYSQSFGWVPDPGCYVQLGLVSFGSDVSWSSDRSFAVFEGTGIDLAHPADAAPYASNACGPEVTGEDGVSGIWKVDPDTRVPTLIIPGGHDPDVECTAGSCLTLLRIVTTAEKEDVEDDPQFTYSGAVSGTTGAVNPLGTGGVLSAKVQAGNRTVIAQGATNYILDTVECDAPSTRTGSSVVVSVVPDDTTTCEFHYVNGDPDPCTIHPDDCTDSDGDGRTDTAEGKPSVDTDGDGTPDYLDTDSDNDGLLDKDESSTDTDGDGIPDWRDPAAHPCAPTLSEGRSWVATAALPGLPNPDLFQFDVGFSWCKVDGRAEITDLDVVGQTVDGFGSLALGLFGFTPKYMEDDLDSTWSPGDHDSTVGITGTFSLCFDVLTLADKLKVRKLASSALETLITKALTKTLRKTDGLYTPAADAKLVAQIDAWARDVRSKLTKLSEALGKAVPRSLRDFLEDKVVGWWDDISDYVRLRLQQTQDARELVGLTPDNVARKVVEDVVGPIWDFAQVCNGLSVWEPAVSIHVGATGSPDISIDGYKNPFLVVKPFGL